MSKIQDALSKLQRTRSAAGQSIGQVPQPPLAHPVDRAHRAVASHGPRDHEYGGVPLAVNRAALRTAGLLAPEAQERRVADEYRQIKRPLLANASADGRDERASLKRGNLWMIGSAVSGEGKTFTCINLCLSLATEKDWSVVLVDADVAKPHVSRLFGLEQAPGLLDLLREPSLSFEKLVSPTDVPKLSVLPAGGRDEYAAELLASDRMSSLCNALSVSDPRRLVVFDSSPLLQTSEAPVLATHMGQLVMVVKAAATSQQKVLAALARVDPPVTTSFILNQARSGMEDEYGGYYGYGQDYHRQGPGEGDRPPG